MEEYFDVFEAHRPYSGLNDEACIQLLRKNLNPGLLDSIYNQNELPKTYNDWKDLSICKTDNSDRGSSLNIMGLNRPLLALVVPEETGSQAVTEEAAEEVTTKKRKVTMEEVEDEDEIRMRRKAKGAPARESRTGTRLVSPAAGREKKK